MTAIDMTPYRLAKLAKLAADVSQQALAERYGAIDRLTAVDCRALYTMLKAVGATDQTDPVMAYLVASMARRGFAVAERRRRAARARREGDT